MPTKYLEMSQLKDVGRDQDMLATDMSVGVYGVVSYCYPYTQDVVAVEECQWLTWIHPCHMKCRAHQFVN